MSKVDELEEIRYLIGRLTTDSRTSKWQSPNRRGRISIDDGIQLYAWHSLHHTAYIKRLLEREVW